MLSNSDVKRQDFKHNFLKTIIVRADFQGVFDPEMEKVLPEVKAWAKNREYEYAEKSANLVNIGIGLNNGQLKSEQNVQKFYSFSDKANVFKLDVTKEFVCLKVQSNSYIPFEDYRDIVPEITKIFESNVTYFSVVRFGLRKINECWVSNKDDIDRLFNKLYVSYYNELGNQTNIKSRHESVFEHSKYKFNYITNIVKTQKDSRDVYDVAIDIDAYARDNETIEALMKDEQKQSEVNELVFKIYKSSLNAEFVKMLTSDESICEERVSGVSRNE